jgi:DNA polymerase I-like protein with 3'-5' exonuclease and polymerase domains
MVIDMSEVVKNEITKQSLQTQLDGFTGYDDRVEGDDRPQGGAVIQGTIIKFNNEGEWVTGDGDELSQELELVASDVARIVQKWINQKPEETIFVAPGEKFPDVEELNKKAPRSEWRENFNGEMVGPWQMQNVLLRRLDGWAPKVGCIVVDTLIASRLILSNLSDLDDQAAAMADPALKKLRGRYSLEAWGLRLGMPKTGTDITDWSTWTPEMQARCVGDVLLCKKLYQFLQPDGYSQQALELEQRIAPICDQITAAGVPFDIAAAEQLKQKWVVRCAELEAQLLQQFSGTNLNSRAQIGALLEARGWVPEKRTEKTGQPMINDELLETLPELYPEFTGLAEYLILRRRLAQLANGKEAWLKHISADGRIHGGLVHVGTPHFRAKHLNPNLAQVPNPKKGGLFATECRALFRASNDWVFVACDQANLQDRGYAHYLTDFDGGAYAKAFLEGKDQHWQSAIALDLASEGVKRDKTDKLHTAIREGAKRFRYAFLYGAGAEKAGRIIHDTTRAMRQIDLNNGLQQRFFGESAHPNQAILKKVGANARNKFMAATPGLRKLREKLEACARRCGCLPGLDGRRVPVRALYSALNFIVTSSEAIICKRWLVRTYDELRALPLWLGW